MAGLCTYVYSNDDDIGILTPPVCLSYATMVTARTAPGLSQVAGPMQGLFTFTPTGIAPSPQFR